MKRTVLIVMLAAILLMSVPIAASADAPAAELPTTMAVSAAWGLRLRLEPGLASETLLILDCSEEVTILGGLGSAVTKNGYRWVNVSVNRDGRDVVGWAALKYLSADLTPNCYLVSWRTCPPRHGHPGGPNSPGRPGGPGGNPD